MPLTSDQLQRLHERFATLLVGPTCTIIDSYFDDHVTLGENVTIHGSRIGAHASIGPGAAIAHARIGNHVRMGANARVLRGVTVGNHAVIEPDAVIAQDLHPGDYLPISDPANDLPLEEFLLEKMPLVHVFNKWSAARGDATLRLDYPLSQSSLAIDVGGYRGDWAHDIFQRYGAQVEVFEPVPAFARQIQDRFRGNSRITVHDFGLAGQTRTEEISLASESSSILRGSADVARQNIRLVAANEFLAAMPRAIDLLKINIEGCEYELLDHLLDAGLIPRIRFLQIQFHDFVPAARARRRAIAARLQQTHHRQWNYPFIWESWQRA